MTEYRTDIDLAKGIGILLVVIGHGILNNTIIPFIVMPLFFSLSGYTFHPPLCEHFTTFIIKKADRLLVPWFFFSIMSGVAELILGRINPEAPFNGPLWFCPVLFISIVSYSALHRFVVKQGLIDAICFLLPFIVWILYKYTEAASILPFYFVISLESIFYIHFGYRCHFFMNISKEKQYAFFLFSTVVFFCGWYCSNVHFNLSHNGYLNGSSYMFCPMLSVIVSISGIVSVLLFSQILKSIRLINWCGTHSLVIMLVHFPVLERLNQFCFSLFQQYPLSFAAKIILVLMAYFITIVWCVFAIKFFSRFLPRIAGYRPLISSQL